MVDKQQHNDLSVPTKNAEDICDDIVRELCNKFVDWHGITNSLVRSIDDAKIPSSHKCAFLSTIEIARLGMLCIPVKSAACSE